MDGFVITTTLALLAGVLLSALVRIRRQNTSIAQLLKAKSEQLEVSEGELRQLAFFDPLTGLPNRRKILDSLDHELYAAEHYGRRGALFFIDIDNFKYINDTLGHDHGDQLLVAIGNRLSENVRESDTVARLGGDEFLLLLESEAVSEELMIRRAASIARKLLSLSERPYNINNHKHHISISIGVAVFPGQDTTSLELLRQADTALYKSKANGKNTVCFFHQDMQKLAEDKLSMEGDLREAIAGDQFYLAYQPQVDSDGYIQGTEALLRWQKPDGTSIGPNEFIPVAEENGLILPIGDWVLETACLQMKEWLEAGLPLRHISVNVSPRQFRHVDFVAQVKRIIAKVGLPGQYLILELTESVVVENVAEAKSKMEQLTKLGIKMSMDDFGTGYSSLSYLSELPFDELKIDQSFVHNLFNDDKNLAITKTIIAMAKSLNLTVLAEGVEVEEQRAFLSKHDCSMYQGFLFHRPLAPEAIEQMLMPEFTSNAAGMLSGA
jgi:diguanylate cyclase (GGDEF)-like protein